MGFQTNLGKLRETGRKIVLPAERIKWIITEELLNEKTRITTAIDIGAGTLYWSKWLSHWISKIYAVDVVYEKEQISKSKRIVLQNDVVRTIECVKDTNTLIWACDVLHHLDIRTADYILREGMKNYNYVVIKDIDMRHKIGNFLNRMHDRILNGEKIRDIDPCELLNLLRNNGFDTKFYEMRKLWYPHFLIVARKCND